MQVGEGSVRGGVVVAVAVVLGGCASAADGAGKNADAGSVLHLGGMDSEEHDATRPAYELAKRTLMLG